MLLRIYPTPLGSTPTTKMTSIQDRGRPCKKRISKCFSGSSPLPKSSYDQTPINSSYVEPFVAKYTEKDLQKIFRMVLERQVPLSNGICEKPLKAKSSDVYHGKSHIKCYNFCQQCEDHFAIGAAKDPNRILFALSFLRNRIIFRW